MQADRTTRAGVQDRDQAAPRRSPLRGARLREGHDVVCSRLMVGRRRSAIGGPQLHQLAALIERIAAAIARLRRRATSCARTPPRRLLSRRSSGRRRKSARKLDLKSSRTVKIAAHALEQLQQRHPAQRLALEAAGEDEIRNADRAHSSRISMARGLSGIVRDRFVFAPLFSRCHGITHRRVSKLISLHFAPIISADRDAVKSKASSARAAGRPHRREGDGRNLDLRVGQGAEMIATDPYDGAVALDVLAGLLRLGKLLGTVTAPSRWVWPDLVIGLAEVDDRFDAASHPTGGLGDARPDRRQHLEHRRGVDLVDGQFVERLTVSLDGGAPLPGVFAVLPQRLMQNEIGLGRFGEGRGRVQQAPRATLSAGRPAAFGGYRRLSPARRRASAARHVFYRPCRGPPRAGARRNDR